MMCGVNGVTSTAGPDILRLGNKIPKNRSKDGLLGHDSVIATGEDVVAGTP